MDQWLIDRSIGTGREVEFEREPSEVLSFYRRRFANGSP